MWRIAFVLPCLVLSACGFNTWSDLPFTTGSNPNRPAGSSENMSRVMGVQVDTVPLTPEPGDIWPAALPDTPTLQDLERGGLQSQMERPVPGSPDSQQRAPATRGSSTPPGSVQPALPRLPSPSASQPTVQATPPAPNPSGQVVPTQRGQGVTSGGTSGYKTITTPGGGSAIVVPNGNGTSTVIHSDGTIETVPTPR